MRIEAATTQTVSAVLKLLGSQFDEHEISLPTEVLSDAVRVLLTEPARGAIFLAYDPDPVGVAVTAFTWTLEHGGLVAWLDELYVVPDRRGHGVGQQLLLRVLDAAREAGCRAVELEVDAEHSRAERLYQRAGFASVPRRRWSMRLNRPGDDAE